MTADVTPVRVVRLVPETGPTTDLPVDEGTGRLVDRPGLAVVDTTDDPGRAGRLMVAGAADCIVCDRADPATALGAVREGAPTAPFLAVLPRDAVDTAEDVLAATATDVLWADDAPVRSLVARRVASLVAAARFEMLRQGREQIDRAVDGLTDLFYVIDSDGRLVHWNRRFNEWWDLTDAEIADRWPWEFLVEEDWSAVEEAIGTVLTEGEASVCVRAALPDGRTPLLELQGRRLADDGGEVIGLCGTGRDVSEQAAREASLRSRNEQLDEFAAVLSHDLRSPLSVAVGSLDIARAERDSPDLERAAGALDRVNDLIGDILRAARQEGATTDPAAVSLRAVSKAAWESVDTAGATLDVPSDAVIRADPARLRRVLENLFRNSVEHGSTDGRDGATGAGTSITVATLAAEDGSPVGFVVVDDGPGIPAADREHVFDRGHSTGDGLGLGLAVVRGLAESHGWQVRVGDGPGARFEFRGVETVPSGA